MHCEHATILAARPNPLAKIETTSFKASQVVVSFAFFILNLIQLDKLVFLHTRLTGELVGGIIRLAGEDRMDSDALAELLSSCFSYFPRCSCLFSVSEQCRVYKDTHLRRQSEEEKK